MSVQPVIQVDLPLDQLHAVLSLVAANVSARSEPWDDALEAAETTIDIALMEYELDAEELERTAEVRCVCGHPMHTGVCRSQPGFPDNGCSCPHGQAACQ